MHSRPERFEFRAMGSPCAIHLFGASRSALAPIAKYCVDEVLRLEQKFSRYRVDSLATRINQSAGDDRGIEVDEETAALLDFADTAHTESDGRFDPTSGVLRRVWDFKSGKLPDPQDLETILCLVGWENVIWDRPRIILPILGMELDFGGFVKEYAADRVAELCRTNGIESGLVDLGGDLAVVGPRPGDRPWLVGIRDPRSPQIAMARIPLSSGGLATSGDYERFMIVDGIRYSHLLDPQTGMSFLGGPACVSVTAPHCLVAGVTSTIAMLNNFQNAGAFLREVGLTHLLISHDGEVSGNAELYATKEPLNENTPSLEAVNSFSAGL